MDQFCDEMVSLSGRARRSRQAGHRAMNKILHKIALLLAAAALSSCTLLYHAWGAEYRRQGGYYNNQR
jgi:hypothetical protein